MPLITLSGIDGSGKSTVAQSLAQEFPDAILTKEPTDEKFGSMLQNRLADPDSDPLINLFLFLADRRKHNNSVIKPAMKRGQMVICDRYADSTRAYQSVALSEPTAPFSSEFDARVAVDSLHHEWLIEPELTLYLDISVDEAIERADGSHKYENRSFLEDVRGNYELLEERYDRVHRIDGSQSREAVVENCVRAMSEEL
jgi:dTMP kinase